MKQEKVEYVFIIHHKRENNKIYYEKFLNLLNMFSHVNFYYFLPRVEYEQAPLKYSILNKPIKHIKKITFEDLNNFINSFKFSNLNIVDQNQFLLERKKILVVNK